MLEHVGSHEASDDSGLVVWGQWLIFYFVQQLHHNFGRVLQHAGAQNRTLYKFGVLGFVVNENYRNHNGPQEQVAENHILHRHVNYFPNIGRPQLYFKHSHCSFIRLHELSNKLKTRNIELIC